MAWRNTSGTRGDGFSTRKTKAMGVCWVGGFKGGGGGSEGHGQGIGSNGNKVSKKFFLPASGLPTPLIPLRYSGAHCQ